LRKPQSISSQLIQIGVLISDPKHPRSESPHHQQNHQYIRLRFSAANKAASTSINAAIKKNENV